MKKIILSTCGGLILTLTTQTTLADKVPANALPMSKILQDLKDKGYITINEVEFKHGTYEVKAIGSQGNKIKLRVNPKTGQINDNKNNNANLMTMLTAVQKLEAAGYNNIYKIELEGSKYEIKAMSKEGKKVKLKLNTYTGEIKKDS